MNLERFGTIDRQEEHFSMVVFGLMAGTLCAKEDILERRLSLA